MVKSDRELHQEYFARLKKNNPEKYKDLNRRRRLSSVKSFIRLHATKTEIDEIQELCKQRLSNL